MAAEGGEDSRHRLMLCAHALPPSPRPVTDFDEPGTRLRTLCLVSVNISLDPRLLLTMQSGSEASTQGGKDVLCLSASLEV